MGSSQTRSSQHEELKRGAQSTSRKALSLPPMGGKLQAPTLSSVLLQTLGWSVDLKILSAICAFYLRYLITPFICLIILVFSILCYFFLIIFGQVQKNVCTTYMFIFKSSFLIKNFSFRFNLEGQSCLGKSSRYILSSLSPVCNFLILPFDILVVLSGVIYCQSSPYGFNNNC